VNAYEGARSGWCGPAAVASTQDDDRLRRRETFLESSQAAVWICGGKIGDAVELSVLIVNVVSTAFTTKTFLACLKFPVRLAKVKFE